jgi:acetylornithine deacetylase
LIEECRAEDPGFVASVRPLRMDRGYDTAADADVVTFLAKASGRPSDTVSFGTEGPQLAALGATPVVFGPGDITVAHQTGEYVPIDELNRAAEILEAAVLHFCG